MKMLLRSSSFKYLALILLLMLPLSAVANPLPDGLLFTHVQPANPGEIPSITSCDEIIQYTTATGEMEFDIYLKSFLYEEYLEVGNARMELEWPATWTLQSFDIPYGGTCVPDVSGNHVVLDIDFANCSAATGNEVLLLARCFITVDGPGILMSPATNTVSVCNPEYEMELFGSVPGHAGVVCDYYYESCTLDHLCRPTTTVDELDLIVVSGESTSASIPYRVSTVYPGDCGATVEGSEEWMTVTMSGIQEWGDFNLLLNVDTEGLDPGNYSGWVSASSAGRACTWIDLEVLPLIAAEEKTWSAIKAEY
ncbi:MAG: hypothetical protein GY835_04585 [bacterium]|nr:hypothetical protein [bacterium]